MKFLRSYVHCIVDNYASHKHPKVRAWRAPDVYLNV